MIPASHFPSSRSQSWRGDICCVPASMAEPVGDLEPHSVRVAKESGGSRLADAAASSAGRARSVHSGVGSLTGSRAASQLATRRTIHPFHTGSTTRTIARPEAESNSSTTSTIVPCSNSQSLCPCRASLDAKTGAGTMLVTLYLLVVPIGWG
eukprot:6188297-Pleurochrysis_carterae.AAC.2